MTTLVTGGAGYIGSHAVARLLAEGRRVLVIDNLSRGHAGSLDRLRAAGGFAPDRLVFERGDIGDRPRVAALLRSHAVTEVLHFAAFASVPESVGEPLAYFRNNTADATALLEACDGAGVQRLVFSSTCATYGMPPPERIPISEDCPQNPVNPYGASKLMFERVLKDFTLARASAGRPFGCAMLRYFNVAGCSRAGVLGEDHDPETHIIPLVLQTLLGQREHLTITGTDYPTPDGTCIRDYIHVDDLVDAHLAVLRALKPGEARAYNLGIGKGVSVREVVRSAERVTGRRVPVKEGPRRPGDPPTLFADPSKIRRELGWSAAVTDLDEIIASAWRWFSANPRGYGGPRSGAGP
ncbi:MAG TPA: UDP-glucose 4-epimerase GalE [Phycisphaerales bacterium]|nr:UDP-glucose 4-epimerase GalE [Phycisphaerales bacterium]